MIRAGVLVALLAIGGCSQSYTRHVPPPEGSVRSRSEAPAVESLPAPEAPPPSAPRAAASPTPDRTGAVLARVGDREFRAEEVARHVFKTLRQPALIALDRLIVREIIVQESARMGLAVPADFVVAERGRILESLRQDAFKAYGQGATPERYVELSFKQPLDAYVQARLEEAREAWLLQRIIRFHAIGADRVELQLIVLNDEAKAREVAAKLDAGADMAHLALECSVHESAPAGGRMVPLAKESLSTQIADRAFALAAGERTGILSVEDGLGRRQFEIIKLLRRHPARNVRWAEVAAEVEAGLLKEPIGNTEYVAWHLRLERLYNVWIDSSL